MCSGCILYSIKELFFNKGEYSSGVPEAKCAILNHIFLCLFGKEFKFIFGITPLHPSTPTPSIYLGMVKLQIGFCHLGLNSHHFQISLNPFRVFLQWALCSYSQTENTVVQQMAHNVLLPFFCSFVKPWHYMLPQCANYCTSEMPEISAGLALSLIPVKKGGLFNP